MEWFWLATTVVIYIICAYLTYKEEWRDESWYLPVAFFFGTMLVVIWYMVIRYIGDKNRIYFYSLCWDTVMVAVYYLVPILFFGIKLDRNGIIGLVLIVVGLALLKIKA